VDEIYFVNVYKNVEFPQFPVIPTSSFMEVIRNIPIIGCWICALQWKFRSFQLPQIGKWKERSFLFAFKTLIFFSHSLPYCA